MNDPKPLKRHPSMQPVSRDHHHTLLFCWKLREGLKHNIDPERIKKYASWFWRTHLTPHFETEEKYIFPILGNENKLVKQARAEHERLKYLFENEKELPKSISMIQDELDKHVRFEERILFYEIQQAASPEQLQRIEKYHQHLPDDEWGDEFWVKKNYKTIITIK